MSPVWIMGTGAVGPCGMGLPTSLPAATGGAFRLVPEGLPLKEGFPAQALRWLDPSSLWWLNAARQALGGASQAPETAQAVGLGWGSTPPVLALVEQLRDHGFSAMAPALFPYSVGNAPAAEAGILLGMKGAALTVCGKEAAGLAAVVESVRLVAAGLFDTCIAGGVDHADPFLQRILRAIHRGAGMPAGEGAYALKLQSGGQPPAGVLAKVASWASRSAACPAHLFPEARPLLEAVTEDLLARAKWERGGVDLVVSPADRPSLRLASECLMESRFPQARPLMFQEALGACGASWAGAVGLASLEIFAGRCRRAVLIAVATGGGAWGIALERADAQ